MVWQPEIEELKRRYAIDFPGVFENEIPAHRVTVGDFRIDRHEVTNAQYAQFLTENRGWLRSRLPSERHNGDYLREWQDDRSPEGLYHPGQVEPAGVNGDLVIREAQFLVHDHRDRHHDDVG